MKQTKSLMQLILIDCYAHRFNFVLVNTIRNIPDRSDCFDVLQTLYTFITNSNTRHVMFVEAQKHLGLKVLQLERTNATLWLYRYRAVPNIVLSYEAVMAVLDASAKSPQGWVSRGCWT